MSTDLTYTDSALSDLFRNFFNQFKEDGDYKYVSLIDSDLIQFKVIEIDYDNFTDVVKDALVGQTKQRIHTAIYRALGEVFQVRHGSGELASLKQENALKFKLNNSELFSSDVYANPKFPYDGEVDLATKTKKEPTTYTTDKFDFVAELIQEDYWFKTIKESKEIWYYDEIECIYRPLGHIIIEEECQKRIKKCNKHTVAEVVDTIRRNGTYVYSKELLESKLINTQNGILNPKTFELLPHSPEYLTTSKLPFSVNHDARNLKLWNHILKIIDPYDINYFMELIWICISWNNPHKKLFVFKGLTNTQKSTLADILVWIVGEANISREKPSKFLGQNSFSTSKFIGKRINIATEIGNLTKEMLENLKALVGAEKQNTERKNDNTEYHLDPTKFVFLFTTNNLGELYSRIDDNAVITRFQFLIFRHAITDDKIDGNWDDEFFTDAQDRQSAIDTIVNIVINYKKAQSKGQIPKTKWSHVDETKRILREEMPKEDKYFADGRIIKKEGSRLTLEEITEDFEKFVGYRVRNPQAMGIILKKNGIQGKSSNNTSIYVGHSFNTAKDQSILQ